jgi:hypothetical protein
MPTIRADAQQHTTGRHVRTDSKSSNASERINAMLTGLAELIAGADGRHAR